jgi:hypothetical protein
LLTQVRLKCDFYLFFRLVLRLTYGMKPHNYALAPVPKVHHRANRLLAALELDDFAALKPHLHEVSLGQDQVLYEAGDPLRHAYFPHNTVVSLVAVLKDGRSAEMAV